MTPDRPATSRLLGVVAACTGLLVGVPAFGLGIERPAGSPVLGAPLDLTVGLRLDAGETLEASCASVEVQVGDRRLPPNLVSVTLQRSADRPSALRVRAGAAVDEPVVTLTVGVGCPTQVRQSFTLLADLPLGSPPSAPSVEMQSVTAFQPQAVTAPPRADTAPAAPDRAERARLATTTEPPAQGQAPRRERQARETRASREREGAQRRSAPARRDPATRPDAAPRAQVERLRLDPPVVRSGSRELSPAASAVIEDAIAAVAQAASAARQAADAASAAQARVAELEKSVAALRADNRRQSDDLARVRERADDLERAVMPLLLGSLVLALLAGWLAWRLRALERERQAAWKEAARSVPRVPAGLTAFDGDALSTPPATTPVPLNDLSSARPAPRAASAREPQPLAEAASTGGEARDSLSSPATVVAPRPASANPAPRGSSTAPAPAAVAPAAARNALHGAPAVPDAPTRPVVGGGSRHALSIEELIDLEQQAEFFTVLGQDDSAIELLAEHIRGSGGAAPLPYLKLLEIHKRQSDRDAYERMRTRFNQRFNAYAPQWDGDADAGRRLEDYPEIVARLQAVWSQPLDAMADLEALMFGKSSHGTVFELPAYRDVLFLYAVARDLLEHTGGKPAVIDVLLPLGAGAVAATVPSLAPEPAQATGPGGLPLIDERALADTRPLEFDLSLNEDSRLQATVRGKGAAGS